jgi:hypothetical protein
MLPLRDFDIVAFSLLFENDYPAVLTASNLQPSPSAQPRRHLSPIMAGACALCPEPLAEFIDLFIIVYEACCPADYGISSPPDRNGDIMLEELADRGIMSALMKACHYFRAP